MPLSVDTRSSARPSRSVAHRIQALSIAPVGTHLERSEGTKASETTTIVKSDARVELYWG